MITENVLKEWYTENASRRFPLATLVPDGEGSVAPTGLDDEGKTLPNSLIVGMQLCVPRTMLATREAGTTLPYDALADSYRIYLKTVIITLARVEITFATVSGEEIAEAVWTPSTEIGNLPVHGVAIAPLPTTDSNIGSTKISGYVFLGPDAAWGPHAAVYSFTGSNIYNSMVSESCIAADADNRVTGLVVNGTSLTGEIEIVAGDNTKLSATGNELRIDFAGDTAEGITSRAELIAAIVELYGDPVLTINNVTPDANGNFSIDSSDGSISVATIDHGVSLTSTVGSECCDKDSLMGMATNIQTLNTKTGRIEAMLRSMESTSSPSAIGASAKNLTIQDFLTIGASSGHGLVSSPVFATGKAAGQGTTILPMTADFLSVTSPANHLKGISFSNGVYVYAVGLVQTTDTGDSLYAACDVSPIAKTANSQVGVRWQTTITIS